MLPNVEYALHKSSTVFRIFKFVVNGKMYTVYSCTGDEHFAKL